MSAGGTATTRTLNRLAVPGLAAVLIAMVAVGVLFVFAPGLVDPLFAALGGR